MMRTLNCLFISVVLMMWNSIGTEAKAADFPVLSGDYIGQGPPGEAPALFAPGIISTDARELCSVFSPGGDEFYYAIYTPDPVDKCTIMVSRRVGNIWTRPETASFSGKFIDVDMAFSPDGGQLYFCSIRPDQPGRAPGPMHDIWFCNRLNNGLWSEPIKLGPEINTSESETYPTFTRNGRMYFSTVRNAGSGGRDIYYSERVNGKYSKPVNIGGAVNTRYSEGDVFVAPDESYLIVSSGGRPEGFGGGDLYISFRNRKGAWTAAKNMGGPINTEMNEYCPMVSPDGKYLFFSRSSGDTSDIFWVDAAIIETFGQNGLK